jgi:glyoxylase-like metal-dependent hydrolase (beta-lactamase superfamily II)
MSFIRQLLPGKDICLRALTPAHGTVFPIARQMANFIYLIGDAKLGKCVVVDPCWDASGILEVVKETKTQIVAIILTHYHFDHAGGLWNGVHIEGVQDLVRRVNIPVYANVEDAPQIQQSQSLSRSQIQYTKHDQCLQITSAGLKLSDADSEGTAAVHVLRDRKAHQDDGGVRLRFLHTPGHSPGSQCISVNGTDLVTGDTLFVGSCGRLDLQDSDKKGMWSSMRLLSSLADETVVWPGHNYGGAKTTIGQERSNGFLRPIPLDHWMKM